MLPKTGRNAYKYGKNNNVSKFVINPHWPSSWTSNMLQIKKHSQKLTPYLLQNDVVFFFESYWKREKVADINFLDFNKLNDWAPQWKKSSVLTGRKHAKIVRLKDGWLNWETPDKFGRLGRYAKEINFYLEFLSFFNVTLL